MMIEGFGVALFPLSYSAATGKQRCETQRLLTESFIYFAYLIIIICVYAQLIFFFLNYGSYLCCLWLHSLWAMNDWVHLVEMEILF